MTKTSLLRKIIKLKHILYFATRLYFTNRGFAKYNPVFFRPRFNRPTEKVVEKVVRDKKSKRNDFVQRAVSRNVRYITSKILFIFASE
jgi:hypothetical protein